MFSFVEEIIAVAVGVVLADATIKHGPEVAQKVSRFCSKLTTKKEEPKAVAA